VDRPMHTILVVEDDMASRKLIRAVLQHDGYHIDEAEDIDTAKSLLAGVPPDMVLLDMRLKKGDGLDLARYIRANERLKNLPIVAVTAQALKGDEERILSAGVDLYFTKPIDTRRLRQTVADIIAKTSAHVQ